MGAQNQLVEITDTKIEGDSTNRGPMIDQTYCKFKTVRLANSHFVSSSKGIHWKQLQPSWLGKEIKVLDRKKDSCLRTLAKNENSS